MDYTVNPIEGLELADQLHDAVKYIRGTYQEAELPELGEGEAIDTSSPADPNVKNYSYTVVDGTVYFRENSRMVRPDLNATAEARVKGMVRLRDCVQELIDLQMDAATPDSDIREKQAELNRLYDDFSTKYGLINDRANRLAFADDSSYYLLCALEIVDEDGRLERASLVHSGTVDPSQDNMLKITSDGRKLGLDQRIINQALPDEPGTKVNQCVTNILQIWRDGEADKLTQLVFCDISTPQVTPSKKAAKALDNPTLHALEQAVPLDEPEPAFTIYEDIRQKLIAQGMPAEQIAFIHEAKTEVQKKELFAKVRTGQVRVLLGSTAKMGAGTNVTDSDIMAASKLLEISYDDLKVFVDQYHTQKEESRANSLSENEIINRLKTIPGVKGVQTATETNDPNGGLNKPGKYVSAIYFELENVDQSCFDANLDIVGKGTDCGGQIEVYANAEDAKRRDDYLANFDGTFLATFHHLYGTMVIRLSDDLTATEQRNMKDAIISALSK